MNFCRYNRHLEFLCFKLKYCESSLKEVRIMHIIMEITKFLRA